MSKSEEWLYPLTIKIKKDMKEKIYFMTLPKEVKENFLKLEQLSNFKYNPMYNLPTNALKDLFTTHLDGAVNINYISQNSDDSRWLISNYQIDVEKVKRILIVWIKAFYIEGTLLRKSRIVNTDVENQVGKLCSIINESTFNVTEEDILLFNDSKADAMIYSVLPLKVVNTLMNKKITIKEKELELYYSDKNEVVTNPILQKNGNNEDYFSYVLKFSVQTLPPHNEAYLNIDMSIRRWVSRNTLDKVPYLQTEKNCYVKVGESKLQRIAANYSRVKKEIAWKDIDEKVFTICYGNQYLKPFKEVILNPKEALEDKLIPILVPYDEKMNKIDHSIDSGMPFFDMETLYKKIAKELKILTNELEYKAYKSRVVSNNPKSYFNEEFLLPEKSKFQKAVELLLQGEPLSIEVWYGHGDEKLRDDMVDILKNHFENTQTEITTHQLDKISSELEVKSEKLILRGVQERIGEIEKKMSEKTHAILSFIILKNRDQFEKPELNDPKKAIRLGFAKTGRLTQFITPEAYYDTEKKMKDEKDKYEKKILAYEEDLLNHDKSNVKKPQKISKGYLSNSVIKHAILDGYRQLGIITDVSKNKSIVNKTVTGIHICNYKNTLFGNRFEPFPIFIKCDFEKGYISGYCDLVDKIEIPYWKLCLGIANKVSMLPSQPATIKPSATIISRRFKWLSSNEGNHIVVIEANGTSRKLIKGIANSEIKNVYDKELNQISSFLINNANNGVIDLKKTMSNLSLVRLRVNSEVPGYYPFTDEGKVNYKSMTGIFKFNDVYYSLDDKASKEADTMRKNHSKTYSSNYYSHRNLVEIYPMFIQNKNSIVELDIVKCVHDLRKASIQSSAGKTTLPLPLHLAKKLEEYII